MAKTEFSNNVICDTCKKPDRLDDIVRSFKVLTSSGEYETGVRACLDCVEIEYKGLYFKRFISYIMLLMLVPGFPLVVNWIREGGSPSLLDFAGTILFALGFCGIFLALVFHNPGKKALDYAIRKSLVHKFPPMATCVKPIREEAPPFVPPADRDGKSFMVKFPSLKLMFGSRLTRLYAIRTLRALGKPKSAKSLVGTMMVQASWGPDHLLADEVLLQELEEAVVELGQVSVKPLIFHLRRQNLKENERKAAVEILSKIGGKEALDALKKAAAKKLKEQKLTAEIAKKENFSIGRKPAAEKLGDREIIPLKEIAYVLVVRNGQMPPDDTLYIHRVLEHTAPEALSARGVKIKGYFEAGSVDQILALSLAVKEWGLDPLDRDKYDLLTQDFMDDEGGGGMVLKCIPKKR